MQVVKYLRERPAQFNAHSFSKLTACHTVEFRAECLDDIHIPLRGSIQTGIYILELLVNHGVVEEEGIDILRQVLLVVYSVKIIGYAAEGHVGNGHFIAGQMESSTLEVHLTFLQRERQQPHSFRNSSMQTAVIPDDIIKHPTGSGATYHKYDIPLAVCP